MYLHFFFFWNLWPQLFHHSCYIFQTEKVSIPLAYCVYKLDVFDCSMSSEPDDIEQSWRNALRIPICFFCLKTMFNKCRTGTLHFLLLLIFLLLILSFSSVSELSHHWQHSGKTADSATSFLIGDFEEMPEKMLC